jgi:TFIIF-interacting CTD phosphatase-like protein
MNDDKQLLENNDDPSMAIFDEIDINGDGVISREEFRIAIEKMRHLDLMKMKQSLNTNDIAFNHKASVLGRRVVVTDEFNCWQFMKSLPEYKYVSHMCPPPALPPKETGAPEYTLVLDMDETLLHCSVDDPSDHNPPDHSFRVNYQGSTFPIHAWLRPYLYDFLEKIHGNFEIVIFTASQAAYANEILNIIDPGKCFHI